MGKYKKLLFNPFEQIAGFTALLIGLAIIILTGIIGYFSGANFDGVIDMHFTGKQLSISSHILEGFINWLSLSIMLLMAGLIFSKTKFRIVDVIGTQALARWPMLILAILSLFVPYENVTNFLMWKALGVGEEVVPGIAEIIIFTVFVICSITLIVWMVALMYKAYSISCNIKGTKAVVSFILALIMAEIASKILVGYMYGYVG